MAVCKVTRAILYKVGIKKVPTTNYYSFTTFLYILKVIFKAPSMIHKKILFCLTV